MNGKQSRKAPSLREQLGYLSDAQVAEFLGIQVPSLHNRRSRGDAPLSSKVGAEHVTKVADLEAYVARRRGAQAAA